MWLSNLKEKINRWCNKNHSTCFIDKCCGKYWGQCAILHDFNYDKQKISRSEADKRFYKCLKKNSYKVIVMIMYIGVRLFGWYFWNKAKKGKNAMGKSGLMNLTEEEFKVIQGMRETKEKEEKIEELSENNEELTINGETVSEEELESIIEDAIKEAECNEQLKSIDAMTMLMNNRADIQEVKALVLGNRKITLDGFADSYDKDIHILEETHYIKKHMSKYAMTVVIIASVLSFFFGVVANENKQTFKEWSEPVIELFSKAEEVKKIAPGE